MCFYAQHARRRPDVRGFMRCMEDPAAQCALFLSPVIHSSGLVSQPFCMIFSDRSVLLGSFPGSHYTQMLYSKVWVYTCGTLHNHDMHHTCHPAPCA